MLIEHVAQRLSNAFDRHPELRTILATVLLDDVQRIEVFVDDDEEAMLVIPAPAER